MGFRRDPYALGGTTYLLECGMGIAEINLRGGWVAERTLSHCLQQTEAAIILLTLPPHAARRRGTCLTQFSFLEYPPQISFAQILQVWTHLPLLARSLPRPS